MTQATTEVTGKSYSGSLSVFCFALQTCATSSAAGHKLLAPAKGS